MLIEREEEYRADIAKRMGLVLGSQRERKQAALKIAPAGAGPLFDEPGFGGGAGGSAGPLLWTDDRANRNEAIA